MKFKTLAFVSVMFLPGISFGAAAIFDELIWTTTISPFAYGSSTFREIDDNNANLFGAAEFHGSNLGNFTVGAELYLVGQQKSSKDNGTDVTGHTLFWSLDGGGTSSTLSYGYQSGPDNAQQWGTDNTGTMTANIINGLTPGNYTLSVWTTVSTNGTNAATTVFNNNGGSNYNATFTVVPEPTSAALGLIGTALLLRRRRF